ncbi:vesicle transport protein SEC20 [Toxorhynchites rutilus septentrionalis]|uniref:vesicle transport protein SEC20 n=1 Tax=Toxorhynchites rutilus septentrionalis TaxID=329112 RepID=UPI002478A303|nr:vesicle transport protein SEC20 [Toxorhynchites rutilus septentrionalis]
MDSQKYTVSSVRQDIIDNNLHVKAIIQDILAFRGTIAELDTLNEAGRAKLAALRKCIERLDDWARDEGDQDVYKEVDQHREQFSRTLQAFRKANISTMLEIEKQQKEELFELSPDNELRQRFPSGVAAAGKSNRSSLLSQQESVTDRMRSISQQLSDTTQKSAATLETLIYSSTSVEGTRDELLNTAGTISQSGKLLKKYGRRECTDKILLFFAFAFFLACVFYIVQKRLF